MSNENENNNNNNNNKPNDITLTSETNDLMNKVFAAAKTQLDALGMHEKILTSDLVDKVVAQTQIKNTIVQGLISIFVEDWERQGEGTIEKGRLGGLFKGGKKPKHIDQRPRCERCNQVWRDKP